MLFETWIIDIRQRGRSTAKKYHGAIYGRLSEMAISNSLSHREIWKVQSVSEFASLKKRLMGLDEFNELNAKGNNMYSAALNMYGQYLEYTATAKT